LSSHKLTHLRRSKQTLRGRYSIAVNHIERISAAALQIREPLIVMFRRALLLLVVSCLLEKRVLGRPSDDAGNNPPQNPALSKQEIDPADGELTELLNQELQHHSKGEDLPSFNEEMHDEALDMIGGHKNKQRVRRAANDGISYRGPAWSCGEFCAEVYPYHSAWRCNNSNGRARSDLCGNDRYCDCCDSRGRSMRGFVGQNMCGHL